MLSHNLSLMQNCLDRVSKLYKDKGLREDNQKRIFT